MPQEIDAIEPDAVADIPASIKPGATAFTRMPYGPHSTDINCVIWARPDLVAP